MELRSYQREAVDAVWNHIAASDTNPAVVLPTGSGKTHVIAEICRDAVQKWNGRVVVLAHVKELLEQAAGKLRAVAPDLPIGVYSAGLGRRDIGYAVTIAGIQSVYQRAHDLGPLDLVIVDEAHLIPPDGEGMYRRFLDDARDLCDHQRVIGLTATPYRMKTGTICGPSPDHVLNDICFEAGVRELIVQGYLCPLRSRAGQAVADTSDLHVRGGEFIAGEVEDLMDKDGLVEAACAEIIAATTERRSVLIFCSGVRHGEHVASILRERHRVECGFVEGNTPAKERDRLIDRFKHGDLKFLANVNVLTTGFDAPNVDCVAMLRPTLSPGLYYQMVGRGFRLSPETGKTDCLVLDFGGNVLRHGPVDAIRLVDTNSAPGEAPAKQCPACDALIHAAYVVCPECGHVFPPRQVKHEARASEEAIVSGHGDGPQRREEHVSEVSYHVHYKRDNPMATPTMRVEYRCGFGQWFREWICFEHPVGGYARRKAEQWWHARSNDPVPDSVDEAVDWANAGALAPPHRITVEKKPGDQWERIVDYELADKPPRLESCDDLPVEPVSIGSAYGIPDEEIPF